MKILIVGHQRHGKDTVAQMIADEIGLTFRGSSYKAAEIFIYDELKEKYGYKSFEECFEDRVNHRAEWHDLICDYNLHDKTRLAKDILKDNDMYVGMRSDAEVEECQKQGIFDLIIGVYDYRKPEEPMDSFNINIWKLCDFVIMNNASLVELRKRVNILCKSISKINQKI